MKAAQAGTAETAAKINIVAQPAAASARQQTQQHGALAKKNAAGSLNIVNENIEAYQSIINLGGNQAYRNIMAAI
jgi:hypothetical protein